MKIRKECSPNYDHDCYGGGILHMGVISVSPAALDFWVTQLGMVEGSMQGIAM